MRQSRETIEQAYRIVYKGGNNTVPLTEQDDKLINNALDQVRVYDGRFPYEENLTEEYIQDNREGQAEIFNGNANVLGIYFKTLGFDYKTICGNEWELVFMLHKDIINKDTRLTEQQIYNKYHGVKKEADAAVPSNQYTAEPVVQEPPISGDNSSTEDNHKEQKEKEKTVMPDKTIGDFLNENGGNVEQSQLDAAAAAAAFNQGGQMNISSTNLAATGEASASEKQFAKDLAQEQKTKRADWTNSNKVKYLVLANYPLKKRIKPGVTTGTIKDPASQLTKILTAVWKDEPSPEGMVDGKVNGVVQIPKCVHTLGQDANYTAVINTLIEARDNGKDTIEVNLNGKPGNFKGVVVNTPDGVKQWTMKEAKLAINEHALAKLMFEGISSGTQLQIAVPSARIIAKKRANGKKLTIDDVTMLKIPGRDNLIDMKEGVIKDPNHIRVYNEINPDVSKAKVNDRYPASSAIAFSYQTAPSADDTNSSGRKVTKRIALKVEMLDTVPSTDPEMAVFAPKEGVGQTVAPYSEAEEMETIEKLFIANIENVGQFSGDVAKKLDDMKNQQNQAAAEEAKQALNSL